MGRLLVLFFMLPWWAYIPASIGVFWAGERVYEQALETETARAAALEMAMPEPVDLAAFDHARDIHLGDEVHVLGRIDHERDYELVKYLNGVPTSTRYLYMIFGANEPADSQVVRAALMLDKDEEARFVEAKADEWTVGMGDVGWVYDFNGFAATTATLDTMAEDAIAEQGLTMAEDFVFIAPFFDGREAALGAQGASGHSRKIGWIAAALVALVGVVKRVMSVRAGAMRDDDGTVGEAVAIPAAGDAAPVFAAAAPVTLPDMIAPDSPLGRITLRQARQAVQPAPVFEAEPEPEPVRRPAALPARDQLDPVTAGLGFAPLAAREAAMAKLSKKPAPARAEIADDTAKLVYDSGDKAPAAKPAAKAEPGEAARPAKRSEIGFYVWLGLGMLAVGMFAYRPALIEAVLPFAVVALFWLGVYIGYQKIRQRIRSAGDRPAKPRRKREDGVLTVSVGAGGHRLDISGAPEASRERGVI